MRGGRALARAALVVGAVALCGPLSGSGLQAQEAGVAPATTLARVDTLLSHGRLAAAEELLYAAVAARPRAPEVRGALAWYLASRARFVISDVLFTEALRFGADATAVARARAMIAPWRERYDGPVATVPFTPTEDGRTIGWFEARSARRTVRVTVDPTATGFAAASAGEVRDLGRALMVGERRLAVARTSVDPTLASGEVRIGLDVLFGHAPRFDERAGTLTLGALPGAEIDAARSIDVPFVLGMPGLWLVERAGSRPVTVESPWGRALLRGSRWRVDTDRSVVVIER